MHHSGSHYEDVFDQLSFLAALNWAICNSLVFTVLIGARGSEAFAQFVFYSIFYHGIILLYILYFLFRYCNAQSHKSQ